MQTEYLLKTPHGWYFRRAVPKAYREILGKSVLKKPLKTRSLSEAQAEARLLTAESEALFRSLGGPVSDFRLGVKVDSAHLTKDGQVILKGIEMDPDKIEAEKAALESIVSTLKSANTSVGKSLTLSAAIQQFAAEKKTVGSWTGKTEDEILAALELLIEVMGDQPIAELTREDAESPLVF